MANGRRVKTCLSLLGLAVIVIGALSLSTDFSASSSLRPRAVKVTKVVGASPPCREAPPLSDFALAFKHRDDLAAILEEEGLTTGAELGVQEGIFANSNLAKWTRAKRYTLVDVWSHIENYDDVANVKDTVQESYYETTKKAVRPFLGRGTSVDICRNYTTSCAPCYADASFDFIYVDARHDYRGVAVDLAEWYVKLRPGGIFAGHDYVTNPAWSLQNWTINFDGTVDPTGRAVQGAVDEFGRRHGVRVYASSDGAWRSWALRKPRCPSARAIVVDVDAVPGGIYAPGPLGQDAQCHTSIETLHAAAGDDIVVSNFHTPRSVTSVTPPFKAPGQCVGFLNAITADPNRNWKHGVVHKMHSQFGQDAALFYSIFAADYVDERGTLLAVDPSARRRTFIDLAANHWRDFSNTLFLEECLGWRGGA